MPLPTSFPKIYHVGDPEIPHLFDGPVEVTEKIDGSQIAFSWQPEGIRIRSKGQEIIEPNRLFQGAFQHIWELVETNVMVRYPGYVFYCETLQVPHHNVLVYDRIPKNHLYLFGVMTPEGHFLDGDFIKNMAQELQIEPVEVMATGECRSLEELMSYLEYESILGGSPVEGIVIKNYNQRVNKWVPISMGKYVSERLTVMMDRYCTVQGGNDE